MAPKVLSHVHTLSGGYAPLQKRQTAAIAMLDEVHADLPKARHDTNVYTLGRTKAHNVVIACLPMGMVNNNKAATVAAHMISTISSIKLGLMVGIGGGMPREVMFGNVMVSQPLNGFSGVVQYDLGRSEDGGFQRTGALNNAPAALLAGLTQMVTKYELVGYEIAEYLENTKKRWPRLARTCSKASKDVAFRPDYYHVKAPNTYNGSDSDSTPTRMKTTKEGQYYDRRQAVRRSTIGRETCVHYGLIASGKQVIKNANERDRIN